MNKAIRFLDNMVDRTMALILILLLLVGVYFVYDTAFVYYNASAARVAYYRPGTQEEAAAVQKPLTEDYVAWLSIDDTNINYPIMQGENNSKYLNLDPYGDYSLTGSIFLDSRNASDFSDSYSLVYGHHMSSGYMFGALDKFYDEAYFDSHRTGELMVGDAVYQLEIFAMLLTDANEGKLFDPQGSDEVLRLAKEVSMHYREPTSNQVLALSTCKDPGSTTRTVVLASLKNKGGFIG